MGRLRRDRKFFNAVRIIVIAGLVAVAAAAGTYLGYLRCQREFNAENEKKTELSVFNAPQRERYLPEVRYEPSVIGGRLNEIAADTVPAVTSAPPVTTAPATVTTPAI